MKPNERIPFLKAFPRTAVLAAITLVTLLASGSCRENHRDTISSSPTPAVSSPPDIILVTIDTLRADSVGYAGNRAASTPFLDSIASSGVVFTNAHAHNVVTLPSHTNILTGLYPYQHGVRDNAGYTLDPSHETVATMLRRAGYATGAFVGAFPLDRRFGLNQGFDLYDDNYGKGETRAQFVVQERPASAVLAAATSWWTSRRGQKRFMWIHLYDPHAPYQPTGAFAERFRSNPYLGEVAQTDDALRTNLQPLLDRPQAPFLVITSDHGEALGDHGELTHGLFAYESTLHIPLLIWERGRLSHGVRSEAVRHIDIVPTILERAGIAVPQPLEGRPLLATGITRDSYFEALSASLNRGWAPLRGVLHAGQKYIDLPIPELYNLPEDPAEKLNLAGTDRRTAAELRRFVDGLASQEVKPRRAISDEEKARLLALGYLGGSSEKKTFTAADDPKRLIAVDNELHKVVELFQKGDLRGARMVADDIVRKLPDMSAGLDMLAFIAEQSGDTTAAIATLQRSIKNGSSTSDMRVRLALLLSHEGRPDEAIRLLEPLSGGSDPDVLNAYGIVLSDLGRNADARSVFNRVLTADPNNAPAYQNLGIVELREGQKQEARQHLDRALQLNSNLPLALNALGVLHAEGSDLSSAIACWKRVVQLDPTQVDALFNLGLVEARSGANGEARTSLRLYIQRADRSRNATDIAEARQILQSLK